MSLLPSNCTPRGDGDEETATNSHWEESNKEIMKTNTSQGLALVTRNGDDDDRHNQTVQSKSLSENQHQNHAHENLLLLTTSANTYASHSHTDSTSISSNTNGQTRSQARQTAAETSGEVTVAGVARVVRAEIVHGVDYTVREPEEDYWSRP